MIEVMTLQQLSKTAPALQKYMYVNGGTAHIPMCEAQFSGGWGEGTSTRPKILKIGNNKERR